MHPQIITIQLGGFEDNDIFNAFYKSERERERERDRKGARETYVYIYRYLFDIFLEIKVTKRMKN